MNLGEERDNMMSSEKLNIPQPSFVPVFTLFYFLFKQARGKLI